MITRRKKSALGRYGIDTKIKFAIILSVLAVIAYMLTQLFWVFFVSFGLWETWGSDIALYDSVTKVAGIIFFMLASTIITYKLFRHKDAGKKELKMKETNVGFNLKNTLKNLLRYLFKKAKIVGGFLKKSVISGTRVLYRSRKTVLFVVVVFLATLLFSFLMATWFYGNDYAPNSNEPNNNEPDDNYDRNIPTTGNITVQGLEIYGGDIKYVPGNNSVYVDWGELSLGVYKNVSFNVRSSSNVNVTLALNVTNWTPLGIENYIDVYWDYNGTVLSSAKEELLVTVTLEVPSSADFIDFLVSNQVTSFGFDMIVYATGV